MGVERGVSDGDWAAADGVVILETTGIEALPESRPARRRRGWVWWAAAATPLLFLAGLAAWAIVDSVREARKAACRENLKRIGLAFQEFHDRHGHFPAPATLDRAGKPLLSWRVALLPFLGHQALFDRFHHDEPWDSPHNRALLPEMPAVFACPSGTDAHEGRTSYLVVVGPKSELGSVNTLFEPGRGVDLREVLDGTSNSILVIEADHDVAWTRPDAELVWTGRDTPPPTLAGPHRQPPARPESTPQGSHVLFADGAVKFLRRSIQPSILHALLTINGMEVTSDG